jgi:hypothetical protein
MAMRVCPKSQSDHLVNNGSTAGKPKKLCQRVPSSLFRRRLPSILVDPLPVTIQDPSNGAMICRAAPGEQLVGMRHLPPGP